MELNLQGKAMGVRSSGAAHTNLAPSYGGGITLLGMVWPFVRHTKAKPEEVASNNSLERSPDYIKSGFIPGLSIGVAAQVLACTGRQDCAQGRTLQGSVTPFIDIRAAPLIQFRLSAPVTRFTAVGTSGTDVAPTFTFATAIASL
jgi:hypothetical protein